MPSCFQGEISEGLNLLPAAAAWQDLVPYIRDRPIQGYGYGGFWTPKVSDVIADKEDWAVPNAHSAYIDYFLALGAASADSVHPLFNKRTMARVSLLSKDEGLPHFAYLLPAS